MLPSAMQMHICIHNIYILFKLNVNITSVNSICKTFLNKNIKCFRSVLFVVKTSVSALEQ